ncbi:MAG: (d)CMP kinase [Dehalococcoidia bacterium]|nr:(d)CMP kinase [Dehalococcoidia bacterium]
MTQPSGEFPAPPLIAIDGLGAVGKTTVGQIVARRLGYRFVDTGEMYRALTWLALHRGIDVGDEPTLTRLASEARLVISTTASAEKRRVVIDGFDVTSDICSQRVDGEVSKISRVAGVRESLVSRQRAMAKEGKLVMVGRDIGTVVLPHAGLKVFLVASAEERARRRHREQRSLPESAYEQILAELKSRDAVDSTRPLSPTVPAHDARIVDTEGLTPEQVADRVLALAKEIT